MDTKFCELLTTQYSLFKSVLEYVYCLVNLIFLSALKQKNWWILISGIVLSPPFTICLKLNCQPINLLALVNRETPSGKLQEETENWELFKRSRE